ncbi:response regulator transcription factor [Paenibacillus agricola]|uniref:Response regulator transcription factor n=1 Tax=Paenibacillus agricola TaxID=2716264 RepID=A0ABX0J9E5_9BACL|nr:response regulator transcription factor [Paenibacillus agricola]NHN33067.1 response regulator transcription factor [Paenibacillus agricola]
MERILIVDDEVDIRRLIRLHIEQAGMQAEEAATGREAIELLQDRSFELMILDLMMDDGNGFEVLNYLRENRLEMLVIILSARRQEQDKIITLGLGADDYVTKPFSPLELIARVQANIRRFIPIAKSHSELNGIVLDLNNYSLHCYGEIYTLTGMEFELLHLFMRNPDRVFTKRGIYRQIWNHDNYNENNLRVYMNRLRKMLDNPSSPINHFQTIRGIGYRFSGDGI